MKLKKTAILLMTILIIIQPSTVSASIIKQAVDDSGYKTYYVSNPEDNFIVFSMIRANMDKSVKIVYSGEMLSYQGDLLQESLRVDFSPQDYVMRTSFGVGTYFSYSLSQNKNDESIVAIYNFSYRQTQEETKLMYDKIHKDIKENINNLKTEYQKAQWAYNWVIDNIHYDESYINTSAYDGFTNVGTVCSGYASLYSAVATELGLECAYVGGTVFERKGLHAWNIVKINDLWYCVDTTWGDSEYGDKFLLKSVNTFLSKEYEYHNSKIYDIYRENGEKFAENDFVSTNFSKSYGVLPSVYNIEMDILKVNKLSINEKYNFMINNPDNIQIEFISTNKKIATVDENGVVTAISKGKTKIIAINKELNIKQTCIIEVN